MGLLDGLDPIAAKIKNPFSVTVKNNGERAPDFPGGFFIAEIIDGEIDPSTSLNLIGNMMPMQPFTWSGEQRLNKDYYPGNPEPVVQVLGGKEGPVIIRGRFKDKRYRDPSYYGVAYEYTKAVDEMRKRGNLVKFGMVGQAADWTRYGFLERGEFKMNKLSWIDYEIEFFVVSENQPQNNYFAAQEKNSPTAVNNNLINAAEQFQSQYSAIPKSMPISIAGLINKGIGAVASQINLVTNFVNTVLSTAQSIENSGVRALGLIKNARAQISKFNRQIDQIAHTFGSHSSSTVAKTIVKDTYQNLTFITEAGGGTVILSAFLSKMQAQFEAIAKRVPKARHKVQKPETLQNISVQYYGVPDHWDKIADHNGLKSTVLVPGTILEIPHL